MRSPSWRMQKSRRRSRWGAQGDRRTVRRHGLRTRWPASSLRRSRSDDPAWKRSRRWRRRWGRSHSIPPVLTVCVWWMIDEDRSDLSLTSSTTAGVCHGWVIQHVLLSTINTTAFHFTTDFSFFFSFLSLPSVTHYWCPLFVCVFFTSHASANPGLFLSLWSETSQVHGEQAEGHKGQEWVPAGFRGHQRLCLQILHPRPLWHHRCEYNIFFWYTNFIVCIFGCIFDQ